MFLKINFILSSHFRKHPQKCSDHESFGIGTPYIIHKAFRELGYSVITLYVDERIKKIEAHNSKVLEDVRKQTITLREVTRGQGVVNCPDCHEDVAWGHLLIHRTRTCTNCRV